MRRGCNGRDVEQHRLRASSSKLPIPVPPLPEQQRIVGILDEAFEGIATAKANAEKNLQNARALFESHLQSVFTQRGEGWVEKRLGEVAAIIDRWHRLADSKIADGIHGRLRANIVSTTRRIDSTLQMTRRRRFMR